MTAYPRWTWISTWLATFAGLGISTYLSIEHLTGSGSLACPDSGMFNCHLVTTSTYSTLAGIPVAYLGFAFFLAAIVLFSPWAWNFRPDVMRWLRLASVSVGLAMVVYLVWAELYRIHGICLWCTSVHVLTLLLFALAVIAEAGGPTSETTR